MDERAEGFDEPLGNVGVIGEQAKELVPGELDQPGRRLGDGVGGPGPPIQQGHLAEGLPGPKPCQDSIVSGRGGQADPDRSFVDDEDGVSGIAPAEHGFLGSHLPHRGHRAHRFELIRR